MKLSSIFLRTLVVFFTLLSITACKTYHEEDLKSFDQTIKNYLQEHNLNFTPTGSGLYYHIDTPGDSLPILLNDIVTFKYEGKLLNGDVFDATDAPVTFQLNQLIAGWKEGIPLVGSGGQIQLLIPPQLGYGDRELDDIPPNSVLYFTIEVVEVK